MCRSIANYYKCSGVGQETYYYSNKQIALGNPVGCQVGVYNLPYFSEEYRFHFNVHNIVEKHFEESTNMLDEIAEFERNSFKLSAKIKLL